MKNAVRLTVSLALSGLFLWLAFRNVALAEAWETLQGVDVSFVLLFLLTLVVIQLVRVFRWGLLIRHLADLSAAELMRIANIERDARVTLLLDHYTTDWRQLWWLRVEGLASVRQGETFGEPETRVAARLREKYVQYGTTRPFSNEPTLIRIEIERLRSWTPSDEPLELVLPE